MTFRRWAKRNIITKILRRCEPIISIGFCDANNYPSNTFVGKNSNSFGLSDEGAIWIGGRCVDPVTFQVIEHLTIFSTISNLICSLQNLTVTIQSQVV